MKMNNGDDHMLYSLTYFVVSNARGTVTACALQVLRKEHTVQIRAPCVAVKTCAPRVNGSTVHSSRDTEQPRRWSKEVTVHIHNEILLIH